MNGAYLVMRRQTMQMMMTINDDIGYHDDDVEDD